MVTSDWASAQAVAVGSDVGSSRIQAGQVAFTAVGVREQYPGARIHEVLQGARLGHLRTSQLTRDLGPGQRLMLSLSRAACTNHQIMLLDETTANRTPCRTSALTGGVRV